MILKEIKLSYTIESEFRRIFFHKRGALGAARDQIYLIQIVHPVVSSLHYSNRENKRIAL
jgi:hypothetical protein